jgi:hypothetical protein
MIRIETGLGGPREPMPSKQYIEMIKSRPGAPNVRSWNKQPKHERDCISNEARANISKAMIRVWLRRKEEGWNRRIEQRA